MRKKKRATTRAKIPQPYIFFTAAGKLIVGIPGKGTRGSTVIGAPMSLLEHTDDQGNHGVMLVPMAHYTGGRHLEFDKGFIVSRHAVSRELLQLFWSCVAFCDKVIVPQFEMMVTAEARAMTQQLGLVIAAQQKEAADAAKSDTEKKPKRVIRREEVHPGTKTVN